MDSIPSLALAHSLPVAICSQSTFALDYLRLLLRPLFRISLSVIHYLTMPAYHSQFNPQPGRTADYRLLCGMALLPLKTKVRGPAPTMSVTATPSAGTMTLCVLVYNVSYLPDGATNDDIIDEALFLFRPNCFFKNYEIQGPADRTLIYLQLFLGECLAKVCTITIHV